MHSKIVVKEHLQLLNYYFAQGIILKTALLTISAQNLSFFSKKKRSIIYNNQLQWQGEKNKFYTDQIFSR